MTDSPSHLPRYLILGFSLILIFVDAPSQAIIDKPNLNLPLQASGKHFPLPALSQTHLNCQYTLKIAKGECSLVILPSNQLLGISWLTYGNLGGGLILIIFLAIYFWWFWEQLNRRKQSVQKNDVELIQINRDKEELEILVKQRTAQLKAANQAKNELLGKIGHELRTPLNIILGFIQLLYRDPTLTQEQRSNLETITRSADYLLALFNDVLEMSRLESGKTTPNYTCFNLHTLLISIKEMLYLKAQAKNLQLIFFLSDDVPQFVKTDENKLRQVLINLLDNAIKFTSKGSVTLRVDGGDKGWALNDDTGDFTSENPYDIFFEIEDTGMGIAPEKLEKIFEAFQQNEKESQANQGVGLGLFISQKLVQLMGGKITVNSIVGQRTIFRFNLPISLPIAEEKSKTQQPIRRVIALASQQPEYRILIVDDKLENRQLLTRLLVPLGFKIQEATNGKEAIEIWFDWRPHLIFMDTKMPIMDGEAAIQEIKAQTQNNQTIIIALTAGNLEAHQSDRLAFLCDDILRKPFHIELLLSKIATHLGVRYVYEERENTPQKESFDSSSSVILDSTSFEVMSPEWITQVYHAASAGHGQLIYELCQQIPPKDSTLANGITELVDNFNFRKIREFTQPRQQENGEGWEVINN